MPITGLVLSLDEDPADRAATIAALRLDHRCLLGEPVDGRWPVVIDTPSVAEDEAARAWLARLPGVRLLELSCAIYAGLDEEGC